MSERQIDWRAFLNRLIYCYGCGRFGIPRHGKRPDGWTLLYQPHPEGSPGLNVCSENCKKEVRDAMAKGPVIRPLRVTSSITMRTEMREAMMAEAMQFAVDEGRMDDLFARALMEETSDDE